MPTSNNPTIKMLRRKPSKWAVEFGEKSGTVERTGIADRGTRWKLVSNFGGGFFPSRRAAFHFFVTGERFKTNPVFEVINGRRSTKRSR